MTETQTEDQLRLRHARIALEHAPALAADLFALATPTDGRTDRGESVPDARIPILSHPYDDANRLYAVLIEWVTYWAEVLDVPAPSNIEARRHRRVLDEDGNPTFPEDGNDTSLIVGFPTGGKLGLTPIRVSALTSILTLWLLTVEDRATQHTDVARVYLDDLASLTWTLRCRYGLTAGGPIHETAARPCPTCGTTAVRVTYYEPTALAASVRAGDRLEPGPIGYPMRVAEDRGKLPVDHLAREDRIDAAYRASFGLTIRCDYCLQEITWRPAARPTIGIIAWAEERGYDIPRIGVPFPPEIRAEYEADAHAERLDDRDPSREWIAAWLS